MGNLWLANPVVDFSLRKPFCSQISKKTGGPHVILISIFRAIFFWSLGNYIASAANAGAARRQNASEITTKSAHHRLSQSKYTHTHTKNSSKRNSKVFKKRRKKKK